MVTAAHSALRQRLKVLPAFSAFVLLGAVPLWLSLSGLLPSLRAIINGAPLIALSPRDAVGLPLALLCFTLAAMTLLPPSGQQAVRARRSASQAGRRKPDWLKMCLGVAMGCVLLTVVCVPLTEFAVSAWLANQNYSRCPAPLHERHPPMRWTRPDGRCP